MAWKIGCLLSPVKPAVKECDFLLVVWYSAGIAKKVFLLLLGYSFPEPGARGKSLFWEIVLSVPVHGPGLEAYRNFLYEIYRRQYGTQVWSHHGLPQEEMSQNNPPSFHTLVFLHLFVL